MLIFCAIMILAVKAMNSFANIKRKGALFMNDTAHLGRITNDLEVKEGKSGKSYISFNIAVNRPFTKDKTDFFSVVAFGTNAEFIAKYFKKGQLIGIQGFLISDDYVDSNGVKHYQTKIVANQVSFAGYNKIDTVTENQ